MLMVPAPNHWGVQRTTEEVKLKVYLPNLRKEVSMFVSECAGCLHREKIYLKDTVSHENSAQRLNQICVWIWSIRCLYLTIKIIIY